MSVLEFLTTAATVFHCPVCNEEFETVKLLKHHILFSHEKKIFCLYCLEKKGWSDEFVKQRNYHEHFDKFHSDVLDTRRRKRLEEEAERRRNPKKRVVAPDGLVRDHPNCCTYCPDLPPFRFVWDRDKHLVDQHQHDFCNICRLIGSSLDVSHHILKHHEGTTCYLCRSLSPPFKPDKLRQHLSRAHNMTDDRPKCPGGGCARTFPTSRNLADHIKEEHGCSEKKLRRLKRNVKSRRDKGLTPPELEHYKGLRNDGHKHCHILSILLMLAHTPISSLIKPHSADCSKHGSCLLAQLFYQYKSSAYIFYPRHLLESSALFNLQEFPYSIGKILRIFLDESILNPAGGRKVSELVTSRMEWKHHCEHCDQFSHTRAREIVIKLNAAENKSLVQHITDFLEKRVCRCGAAVQTKPYKIEFSEFLFLEIDRTRPSINKSCVELSLYPLQLQDTISLRGISYSVVCLVNPDVGLDGHYSTNFVKNHQIVSIHETSVTVKTMYPGFDQTSLLVALQRRDQLVDNAKDNMPSNAKNNMPVKDVIVKTPVTALNSDGIILDLSLIQTSAVTTQITPISGGESDNSFALPSLGDANTIGTTISSKQRVAILGTPSDFRTPTSEYKSDNILGTPLSRSQSDNVNRTTLYEKQNENMASTTEMQFPKQNEGVSPSLMPTGGLGQVQTLLAFPSEVLGTISLPLTLDTTGAPWLDVGSLEEGVDGSLQCVVGPLEEAMGTLQGEVGSSIYNSRCNLTTPDPFNLTVQNANSGIEAVANDSEIGIMCGESSGFEAAQQKSNMETNYEQNTEIEVGYIGEDLGESSEIGRNYVRRSEIVASAIRNANICDSDLQSSEIGDLPQKDSETATKSARETTQPNNKKEYVEFSFEGKQRRSKYLSEESLKLLLESDPQLLVKHREKYKAEMERKMSQKFKSSPLGVSTKLKAAAYKRKPKSKPSTGLNCIDYNSSSSLESTSFNPADLF